MGRIKANKKSLIRWKIYIDRARMYVGYVQFMMIGFVFLKAYEDTRVGALIFDNLMISIPMIILICIFLFLCPTFQLTVFGFREEELRNSSSNNPILQKMVKDLDEIKRKIQG